MDTANDLTAAYVAQFEEAKAALPGAGVAWLGALRGNAIRRFADAGFPTPRVEDWKYTNLNRMTRSAFASGGATARVEGLDIARWVLDRTQPYRLVFVNGVFAPTLSDVSDPPEGVVITTVGQALETDADELDGRLGAVAPLNGNGLVALNTAMMRDGLVVRLAPEAVADRPIHFLHIATPGAEPVAAHPRNLVVAGEGSRATVIETFAGADGPVYWTNAVTEIDIGMGARIAHVKLQEEGSGAFHIGMARIRLARDAGYEGFVLSTGAGLARNEYRIAVAGEGATCRLTGGSLIRGRQHSDITTEIDHRLAHGQSAQLIKNVVDDRARSVFQGRIIVQPDAQKTDAQQSNRNLLLSPRAQADTKPELKIFADDVKCGHGATVGDLDDNALFYLLSRGIDPERARGLLIGAFVSELLDALPDGAIREDVSSRLSRWLDAGSDELEAAA